MSLLIGILISTFLFGYLVLPPLSTLIGGDSKYIRKIVIEVWIGAVLLRLFFQLLYVIL